MRAGEIPAWSCPGLVEKRSGAFFRFVKFTTNAPPCRAATAGTRHGQGYQQASRSAWASARPAERTDPHGKLLPKREVLESQLAMCANRGPQRPNEDPKPSDHDWPIAW